MIKRASVPHGLDDYRMIVVYKSGFILLKERPDLYLRYR